MHAHASIPVSDLMLVKSYLHWGTRLKFCQEAKKGSIGRSQPGRDDAVSVAGNALHLSMHAAGGLMRSRVCSQGSETTGFGGSRISASDDDNALNRMKG